MIFCLDMLLFWYSTISIRSWPRQIRDRFLSPTLAWTQGTTIIQRTLGSLTSCQRSRRYTAIRRWSQVQARQFLRQPPQDARSSPKKLLELPCGHAAWLHLSWLFHSTWKCICPVDDEGEETRLRDDHGAAIPVAEPTSPLCTPVNWVAQSLRNGILKSL